MITTVRPRLGQSLHPATIADAVARARYTGRAAYFSQIARLPFTPDHLAFLESSSREVGRGTLWVSPRGESAFAGAGSVAEIIHDGPGRFSATSAAVRDLRTRLVRGETDAPFPIVGGFAFADHATDSPMWRDYPGALLVVPAAVLQTSNNDSLLRVTIRIDPESSPDDCQNLLDRQFLRAWRWAQSTLGCPSPPLSIARRSIPERRSWESSVATAVAVIRQDPLDKVVLAREERILADAVFSPTATLARLRAADPAATLFAMQSRSSWFLGATPERLVRLSGERVDVSCLAGSIGVGGSPRERECLAQQLLSSAKDREEHEIVVRSTLAALADVCESVTRLLATPRVVPARTVQHLETPITATLPAAGQVLDLVERLHPTPAVGGFPRGAAMNLIRELEEIDRGWYAGPFGWTDLDGSGEFAVALRSALLTGRSASLFAGCGIVADSIPSREYEETCLKLRPMLAALGAE